MAGVVTEKATRRRARSGSIKIPVPAGPRHQTDSLLTPFLPLLRMPEVQWELVYLSLHRRVGARPNWYDFTHDDKPAPQTVEIGQWKCSFGQWKWLNCKMRSPGNCAEQLILPLCIERCAERRRGGGFSPRYMAAIPKAMIRATSVERGRSLALSNMAASPDN